MSKSPAPEELLFDSVSLLNLSISLLSSSPFSESSSSSILSRSDLGVDADRGGGERSVGLKCTGVMSSRSGVSPDICFSTSFALCSCLVVKFPVSTSLTSRCPDLDRFSCRSTYAVKSSSSFLPSTAFRMIKKMPMQNANIPASTISLK